MADNVTFQTGTIASPPEGLIISTDEGAGGHVQRMKLAQSADGSEAHIQADGDGLLVNLGSNNDVTVSGTVTVDGSGVTQPVSGTVTVQDGGGAITVDGTVAAAQSGSWSVTADIGAGPFAVTDNNGSLTVDGSVSVTGTVSVDGSGHTQPVSGTVTVQDGGGSITIDGTVAATQSGSWTVTSALAASGTATLASVNDTASSATLLAANANRVGFAIFNDSAASLYVKYGTTASTTSFTFLIDPYGFYEFAGAGVYTGRIDGIWSSDSTGAARVTEW